MDENGREEALLTPGEVAARFRVDPKTVTRWANAGKLTAVRLPEREFVQVDYVG